MEGNQVMNITVILSIIGFIGILAVIILVRAKYNKFEVKPADIVLALIPIVIYLLVTGQIKTLELGGLKFETAFVKATQSSITPQVTSIKNFNLESPNLPVTEMEVDIKGLAVKIPTLIKEKAEGLEFRLGYGRYAGFAIEQYLSALTKYPFFHYIIIDYPDGTFFGMSNGPALYGLLSGLRPLFSANDVALWINTSNKEALRKLPGFISVGDSLNDKTTDKSKALQKMETLNVDTLPVINEAHKFVGIVNRSRLTASLLIDVSQRLKEDK
jgi:hypothetical protein